MAANIPLTRCAWCGQDALYQAYHDTEWGVPVRDDHKMFEMLLLETFQAGLSWITVLRKRENFRRVFLDFVPEKVAAMPDDALEAALTDPGIIRNRLKVYAARSNAQAFLQVAQTHGSFCHYLWSYVDHTPVKNAWRSTSELPARTDLSDRISKDLKKQGFKFVGSTVVYAHLQASGLVNDHITDCFRYNSL